MGRPDAGPAGRPRGAARPHRRRAAGPRPPPDRPLPAPTTPPRAVPASVRWVTNQNGRWGSCTPADRTIRISHRIQDMPDWVIDYVLLHELAHLVVPQPQRPASGRWSPATRRRSGPAATWRGWPPRPATVLGGLTDWRRTRPVRSTHAARSAGRAVLAPCRPGRRPASTRPWRTALAEDVVDLLATLAEVDAGRRRRRRPTGALAEEIAWPGMPIYELPRLTVGAALAAAAADGYDQAGGHRRRRARPAGDDARQAAAAADHPRSRWPRPAGTGGLLGLAARLPAPAGCPMPSTRAG